MEIIKNRVIVDDATKHLADDAPVPATGDVTVSLSRYGAEREALAARADRVGVRIKPDEDVDEIVPHLGQIKLIAVEFPKFTDGRGYSTARLLRERHGYRGELRAIGHVLRDQLFYMQRVGFDAFEMAPGKSVQDALNAFSDFSVTYQTTGA
ncbi:MAG: DUF934 domain-containing protein [Myxococcota bacterium]